ncbi:class I SAM-dependent methyltransferase [Streptomyces sp. NPDC127051]|uniref:class I SAM-dependent methyltransferase n=1 Tax=Streptomyces sp. NPDC127051 TaxID=3347119 RepID=UPI00365361CC
MTRSIAATVQAWDVAEPGVLHPFRAISEDIYWASGRNHADLLSTVLAPGSRVVDFGCGDGRVAVPLQALGYSVIGVDAAPSILARLSTDIRAELSNGTDLLAALGGQADAIICIGVLPSRGYEAGAEIISGLRAALRHDGLLILDWPTSEQPVEGETWLQPTTWSLERQDQLCQEIGMKRLELGLPWPAFQAAA